MIRQNIPNDNSCLFSAVDFLLADGVFRDGAACALRVECVDHIRANPEKFNELYLGKSHAEYCEWLMQDSSWGGEIEILIISELKDVQISVVQIDSLNVLTYSPPSSLLSQRRIYILYTGQHYDALMVDGCTIFDANNATEIGKREELAVECARSHRKAWEEMLRTRTRKRIRCLGCQAVVVDAAAFQAHCMEVEHADDFCFDCEDIEVVEKVENPTDD